MTWFNKGLLRILHPLDTFFLNFFYPIFRDSVNKIGGQRFIQWKLNGAARSLVIGQFFFKSFDHSGMGVKTYMVFKSRKLKQNPLVRQSWLTLLKGNKGNPTNVELTFELETAKEAEAMQQAFIREGASGQEPSDQLMYTPVRLCPVVDPFGVDVMIFAKI